MYGIGHGGAEMLLVGAQTMANNLILLLVLRLAGAQALIAGMEAVRETGLDVIALQDLPQWEG